MNRKNIFAALACALLVFSMLGCGTSNKLQSITLGVPNGKSLGGGVYELKGDGSTLQLQAMGSYSDNKTKDLTSKVTWNVIVDPNYTQNSSGGTLLPPCAAPACPSPSTPPFTQGTVEYSPTGLITSVEPATCTWVMQGSGWFFSGAYQVTATFQGVTSQPIYIPVASQAGPGPNGQCGP